jgi:hypothetical protein
MEWSKAMENRVRRRLRRHGYSLEKTRYRDSRNQYYGTVWVWDYNHNLVDTLPFNGTDDPRLWDELIRWTDQMDAQLTR